MELESCKHKGGEKLLHILLTFLCLALLKSLEMPSVFCLFSFGVNFIACE